jgi:hypothetical protein
MNNFPFEANLPEEFGGHFRSDGFIKSLNGLIEKAAQDSIQETRPSVRLAVLQNGAQCGGGIDDPIVQKQPNQQSQSSSSSSRKC